MPGQRARPVRRCRSGKRTSRKAETAPQPDPYGRWRTPAGAEAFLALCSDIATAPKHGRNPLAVLGQLFEGRPWLPAPAPGPPPAPCPG